MWRQENRYNSARLGFAFGYLLAAAVGPPDWGWQVYLDAVLLHFTEMPAFQVSTHSVRTERVLST